MCGWGYQGTFKSSRFWETIFFASLISFKQEVSDITNHKEALENIIS